jgi:hypothetical protein
MANSSGWTIDTLHAHISALIAASDKRYEQRFEAAQKAIELGFAAQKAAVDAALTSQSAAVIKAELAADKRFECVSIDTPILCADLTWRPAGDLVAGDELLAFDEESPSRRGRLFRRAVVTANSHREDSLWMVKTPEGSVRCNAKHPWLVRRPRSTRSGMTNGIWAWVKTGDLKIGDEVMKAMDTWDIDRSWESGWLAGMLDGEGCLCLNKNGGAQLSIAQRESLTSTRIGDVLRSRLSTFVTFRQEAGTRSTVRNTCAFFHFIVSARADILKVLGSVRPPRLVGKAGGVWEGKPLGGKNRRTIVTSIEDVGIGTIAALSTSTRTYLAGGFAMHNSVNEFRNTLADQQRNLIPRSEVEVIARGMADKIAVIQKELDGLRAERVGVKGGYGLAVGVVGFVLTLVSIGVLVFNVVR